MNKFLLICLMYSANSFGWGCPELGDFGDLSKQWSVAEHVFVGNVIKGELREPSGDKNRYFYTVDIEVSLKGKRNGLVEFIGDSTTPGLAIGENHVFFTKDNFRLSVCTLVLPFEFHWSERYDISQADYVRKIINLSKIKP